MQVKEHRTGDFIDTPELVVAFIEEFLGDDPETFKFALHEVAESVGFAELANRAGIPRPHLYTMLSENGNPTLVSLNKLVAAIGCRLSIVPLE